MTIWIRLAQWCLRGSGMVIVSPQQLIDLDRSARESAKSWALLTVCESLTPLIVAEWDEDETPPTRH